MIHVFPKRLLLLALIILSQVITSCEFKDITLERVEGFQVESLKGGKLKGTLTVVLNNPNSFDVKVKSGEFDVLNGDKHMGTAELGNSFKILSNTTESYPIPVEAEVGNLLSGGLSSLAGLLTGKAPKFKLKGELKAGNWLYTKKVPVEIETDLPIDQFL